MNGALWTAKTGLDAQQTRMQVISNNLANTNTTGFKRDRAVFQDLLYQTVRQPGAQSSQDTQLPTGLSTGTGVPAVSCWARCSALIPAVLLGSNPSQNWRNRLAVSSGAAGS